MNYAPTLVCPECGAPLLSIFPRNGRMPAADFAASCGRAPGCDFPVVGGVPLLLRDVRSYVSRHRESILATLAEAGRLTPETVLTTRIFTDGGVEAEPFSDDWTSSEEAGVPFPRAKDLSPMLASLIEPLRGKSGASVGVALRTLLAKRARKTSKEGALCIIGAGAGVSLKEWLPRAATAVVVVDLSLRGALLAQDRLNLLAERRDSTTVVADAEDLPFAEGSMATVVAENVIDLLGAPERFLRSAFRTLAPGGYLLLSTPDPSLGTDDDGAMDAKLQRAGFEIAASVDDLLWPRVHGRRRAEMYVVRAVLARKPVSRPGTTRNEGALR